VLRRATSSGTSGARGSRASRVTADMHCVWATVTSAEHVNKGHAAATGGKCETDR